MNTTNNIIATQEILGSEQEIYVASAYFCTIIILGFILVRSLLSLRKLKCD